MTERYQEGSGGGGFTMGLVVGAAFGAVAAMLFAPKPGWEMRRDLADSAGDLGQTAKDRWEDVTEAASSAVDKGRRGLRGGARDGSECGGQREWLAAVLTFHWAGRCGNRPIPFAIAPVVAAWFLVMKAQPGDGPVGRRPYFSGGERFRGQTTLPAGWRGRRARRVTIRFCARMRRIGRPTIALDSHRARLEAAPDFGSFAAGGWIDFDAS